MVSARNQSMVWIPSLFGEPKALLASRTEVKKFSAEHAGSISHLDRPILHCGSARRHRESHLPCDFSHENHRRATLHTITHPHTSDESSAAMSGAGLLPQEQRRECVGAMHKIGVSSAGDAGDSHSTAQCFMRICGAVFWLWSQGFISAVILSIEPLYCVYLSNRAPSIPRVGALPQGPTRVRLQ
ncbi:hypothetical protein EDD16DRAFT_603198 [Pisolithus croceorrhizus]|nr:hypothetical protein EDD16DRAFT_603198 [Pisolithus croceorrhizus]KAI6161589.1 hypothetical protein EDD17DRAFT_681202 [Pisolithus thermaeus]